MARLANRPHAENAARMIDSAMNRWNILSVMLSDRVLRGPMRRVFGARMVFPIMRMGRKKTRRKPTREERPMDPLLLVAQV
jgi:hypothetical protein